MIAALVMLCASLYSAGSEAAWWKAPQAPGAATSMAEGRLQSGPRAYHAMCAREPILCSPDRLAQLALAGVAAAPAVMTPNRWEDLLAVNHRINTQIRPRDDLDIYGVADYWTEGRYVGDCEDYIVAKKLALIRAGWGADQLLYAVVRGTRAPHHAVLVLRAETGDYILDNLTYKVSAWEETGYQFVMRQSAAAPARWVQVTGRSPAPMGIDLFATED